MTRLDEILSIDLEPTLWSIHENFMRADRIQREFGEILLAQYNTKEELNVHDAIIKLGSLFLEFKEILDSQQSLWGYLKDCVEADREEFLKRLDALEIPKAKALTRKKTK